MHQASGSLRDRIHPRGLLAAALAVTALSAAPAMAGIVGGFDTGDGYAMTVSLPVDPTLLDHYNAGQYGTNNGGPGGAFTAISPGTGLWVEMQPNTNGYVLAAADGNHTVAGPGPCLDLRGGNIHNFRSTGLPVVDGEWLYSLDSRDLGGLTPGAINNDRVVTLNFYYCGGVAWQGDDPGVFRMGFLDGLGNTGFDLGLWDNSNIYYRGVGSPVVTSVFMGPGGTYPWTYFRVVMDFVNDTFSFGITPSLNAGIFASDLAPPATWLIQNAPMRGAGMKNLTQIRFWVDSELGLPGTTGVNGSNKQLLDDFTVQVGEPALPVIGSTWGGVKSLFEGASGHE